jgi:hypothetical protein
MRHRESKRTGRQLEEIALCDVNLIILAERELAAFARAVRELFGPELASLSAADWIDELESLNLPARPGASDLRRVTAAASARLADRRPLRPNMKPRGVAASIRNVQQ